MPFPTYYRQTFYYGEWRRIIQYGKNINTKETEEDKMTLKERIAVFGGDNLELIVKASHFAGMMEAKKEITVHDWEDLMGSIVEYVSWFLEDMEAFELMPDFFDELELRLLKAFPNTGRSATRLPEGWKTVRYIRIDDETYDDGTYDVMVYVETQDENGKCQDSERDERLSVGHIRSLRCARNMVDRIISGNPHLSFIKLDTLICHG